jgi:hypothetical protein
MAAYGILKGKSSSTQVLIPDARPSHRFFFRKVHDVQTKPIPTNIMKIPKGML